MEAGQAQKTARGVFVGYKLGGGRQYPQIALVKVEDDIAGRYVGGRARYVDSKGNVYRGRVLRLHGKKGNVVEVRFKPNLPGQALGGTVILEAPKRG